MQAARTGKRVEDRESLNQTKTMFFNCSFYSLEKVKKEWSILILDANLRLLNSHSWWKFFPSLMEGYTRHWICRWIRCRVWSFQVWRYYEGAPPWKRNNAGRSCGKVAYTENYSGSDRKLPCRYTTVNFGKSRKFFGKKVKIGII